MAKIRSIVHTNAHLSKYDRNLENLILLMYNSELALYGPPWEFLNKNLCISISQKWHLFISGIHMMIQTIKKKNSNYPHKNHQINKKHSESITTPQTSSTPSSEADPHATPKRATKSNRRRTHTPMPRTRGPWPRSSLLSNPWLGHGGWVWYPPAAWGGRYLLVDGRMHSSALGSSASRRTTSRNVLTPYWWAVPYLAR